jgi:hypothetical protein
VAAELLVLQQQRDSLADAEVPQLSSLSVEGKRLVNTATLAYAQQLLERIGHDGLALMVKEASSKQITDVQYGSAQECQQWLGILQVQLRSLNSSPRDLQQLKRSNACYRSDHDTVPVPETIGAVAVRTAVANPAQPPLSEEINVLLDDYWGLYSVLLH